MRSSFVYASDLESFGGQDARGFHNADGIGQQRRLVGNHFELDPLVESRRARDPCVPAGVGDRVATGGVGEQEIPRRVEVREDAFVLGSVEIDPPDRDGDDFRARRGDRVAHQGGGARTCLCRPSGASETPGPR